MRRAKATDITCMSFIAKGDSRVSQIVKPLWLVGRKNTQRTPTRPQADYFEKHLSGRSKTSRQGFSSSRIAVTPQWTREDFNGAALRMPPGQKASREPQEKGQDMQQIWVWVKIKPPGNGPQVLVHVSIYRSGNPFWGDPIFDHHTHLWTGAVRRRLFLRLVSAESSHGRACNASGF